MAKKTAVKSKANGKTAFKKKAAAKAQTTAKKKLTAKKAVKPQKAVVKNTAAFKTPLTKTGIMMHIAESTGFKKSDIKAIFDSLEQVVECHIGSKGSAGTFSLPGLLKIQRINKPARKARKGINPFTGEETEFKAKPAHNVVKIRALKKLKDMVAK